MTPVLLLGVYLEETKIEKDTFTSMFIAALLTISRIWRQCRWPSTDNWIKKLWYIYTMEYYSVIKKEYIWVTLNEVGERKAYYIEWSKSEEKDKYHMLCCAVLCLVAQLCPTLCNPLDCCTLGFPVLHHLQKLTQTHVHWVNDAIHPSCPLSSPSPPAFNLPQHHGLF